MKNKFKIKENSKRLLALTVAVVILISTLPIIFANAADYVPTDFEGSSLLDDGGFEDLRYRKRKNLIQIQLLLMCVVAHSRFMVSVKTQKLIGMI